MSPQTQTGPRTLPAAHGGRPTGGDAGAGSTLECLAGYRDKRRFVERNLHVLESEQFGVLFGERVLWLGGDVHG